MAPCQDGTASRIAVCTLHSPGTSHLRLTWDLQHSCLGLSSLCSLLAYSHPSSRLCLLYGQQLRTVSFLYSPPWGAAFQMMLLLCSCHASPELTPLTPAASNPDHTEVTALALGMSTPCSNALCLGKTAARELSPLVLLLPKLRPAENHEGD